MLPRHIGALSVVVTLSLFAAPVFPQDEGDRRIQVTKIAENIYKLGVNDFVNVVAYVGHGDVVLVDTGFADNADEVRAVLGKHGGDRIRFIVSSHADFDHVDGNAVLGDGATILAHSNGRKRLLELIDSGHRLFQKFPRRYVPAITFDDSVSIYLDTEEIVLIPLPGGHTDSDLVVYFKNANVACLGDILLPDSFPVVKLDMGGNVESLVDSIERLIDRFPDNVTLIVGHGRDATMQDLERYASMLHETIGIVSKAIEAGKSCEDVKKENLLGAWAEWSGSLFEEVDSEMWIETICQDLSSEHR